MVNKEHLALLRQGVDVWNMWRKNNCHVQPDLHQAYLRGADLRGAYLFGSDLREAELNWADLTRADLRGAELRGAQLNWANLSKADLSRANLSEAHLFMADLSEANLSGSILKETKLNEANLIKVKLIKANLLRANLSRANLSGAKLMGADLILAEALDTNFKEAIFTGACLEDWNVNSTTNLDSVFCDYVYLRQAQQERCPVSGNFASGEFTKIFKKANKTIDVVFRNGIDWQAFFNIFQKLQVECHGSQLTIQAIENKNDDAFVIRLNVPLNTDTTEIVKFIKREYESAIKVIDEKYRQQLKATDEQIAIYRQRSTDLTDIAMLMAKKPINLNAQTGSDSRL